VINLFEELDAVNKKTDPKIRFWSKVEKTKTCWLWIASLDTDGYGLFRINRRLKKAHRLSFEWSTGEKPKLFILHKCDTPACVNPDHLFEGTALDNARDRDRKGRANSNYGYSKGPNKNRRYSNIEADKIRDEYKSGSTYEELAASYQMSTGTAHQIINRYGAYL